MGKYTLVMDKQPVPYERTVFVCAHARTDGRAACDNPGRNGEAICGALKKAIKERGLKDRIRVAKTGCLDRCGQGPNIFIYPENEWLSGVSEADIPDLLKRIAPSD